MAVSQFERLARRVEDIERRMRGAFRQGTVAEVDPAAGTVRLKLGENDQGDYLSAPIPYAQTAGAVKFHNPPSVGQQMMAMSPGGDLRQAVAMPLGFSEGNASPSGAGDQHVMTFGSVTITIKGDEVSVATGGKVTIEAASEVSLSAGGCDAVLSGSGLAVTGGQVTHNGTDIGDSHTHSGITSGPSRTGDPK